jgi:hypothetical protein
MGLTVGSIAVLIGQMFFGLTLPWAPQYCMPR